MSERNLFEVASREKFRFPFKGNVSVEDLWDLNVGSLDQVFKVLNSELKQAKEESLLDIRSKQDTELDMKIEIVKYIVSIKQTEASEKLAEKTKKEQKQKILSILETKREVSLQNKSEEELLVLLDTL